MPGMPRPREVDLPISARAGSVDRCTIMDTLQAAHEMERRGRRVIHFEVGQASGPAPAAARSAAADAMADGALGYTDAAGLPELRAGIARLYAERHGLALDPERVVVTAGASAGFVLAMINLFDPGDRIALWDPSYPSYRNLMRSLGIVPVGIAARAETGFQPRASDLGPGLSGVLLCSPANPTGAIIPRTTLSSIMAAAADRGLAVISDEVYHGMHYDAPAVSALEISDDAYVINSFSKYFSMTGWRVGWMVVPPTHIGAVEALAQNLYICAPHVSQVAALAALGASAEMEARLLVYRRNRDLLLAALPGIGFGRIVPPDGGFFLYADVSGLTGDSGILCSEILEETGVALTPGNDFDPERGARYVRLCYACDSEQIEEGLDRLAAWARGRLRAGDRGN